MNRFYDAVLQCDEGGMGSFTGRNPFVFDFINFQNSGFRYSASYDLQLVPHGNVVSVVGSRLQASGIERALGWAFASLPVKGVYELPLDTAFRDFAAVNFTQTF